MESDRTVTVFGAYGHTGRFVVSELRRRGWNAILSGRDGGKLRALQQTYPEYDAREATVDDGASLDRAFAGASAVINCAGPFADTAMPIVEAALRARIHYLDVAAEQPAVLAVIERFAESVRTGHVTVLPGMAFYGALGDLLATATMGDWSSADEICIRVALDRWYPTRGTRLTGQRNSVHHIFSDNRLQDPESPHPHQWNFPPPFGTQEVVLLPLAETVMISRHLRTPQIGSYINVSSLADVRDPNTPMPTAADETGRSSQIFVMDVVVRQGFAERRAIATGQDIYAISAPIVVEAVDRVLSGCFKSSGVMAAGEAFDANDFLTCLSPHLAFEIRRSPEPSLIAPKNR
jgi:NAD(P)-dependent dehydrogenase (short-subunit alcohol dehydrogenase family)